MHYCANTMISFFRYYSGLWWEFAFVASHTNLALALVRLATAAVEIPPLAHMEWVMQRRSQVMVSYVSPQLQLSLPQFMSTRLKSACRLCNVFLAAAHRKSNDTRR